MASVSTEKVQGSGECPFNSMYSMLAFVAPASTFGMVSPLKLIANSPLVALCTRKCGKYEESRDWHGRNIPHAKQQNLGKFHAPYCILVKHRLCINSWLSGPYGHTPEADPRLVPQDHGLLPPPASVRVHTSNNTKGRRPARIDVTYTASTTGGCRGCLNRSK